MRRSFYRKRSLKLQPLVSETLNRNGTKRIFIRQKPILLFAHLNGKLVVIAWTPVAILCWILHSGSKVLRILALRT